MLTFKGTLTILAVSSFALFAIVTILSALVVPRIQDPGCSIYFISDGYRLYRPFAFASFGCVVVYEIALLCMQEQEFTESHVPRLWGLLYLLTIVGSISGFGLVAFIPTGSMHYAGVAIFTLLCSMQFAIMIYKDSDTIAHRRLTAAIFFALVLIIYLTVATVYFARYVSLEQESVHCCSSLPPDGCPHQRSDAIVVEYIGAILYVVIWGRTTYLLRNHDQVMDRDVQAPVPPGAQMQEQDTLSRMSLLNRTTQETRTVLKVCWTT